MFDSLRWMRVKHDSPPGSLIYAGEGRDFAPFIEVCAYSRDTLDEQRLDPGQSITFAPDRVNLVVVVGIHDVETIRRVGADLGFPALALEDVMNAGQRAKFAWADDETAFIVLKNLTEEDGGLVSEQVSLFWRDNLVAVFLEREDDLLDGVLARIRKGKGRLRAEGGAYLMCSILDVLVDCNMAALTRFGELAEALEARLEGRTTNDLLGRLYTLKREVILLRNQLVPMREIFKALLGDDADLPEPVLPFLRDAAGHHEQAVDAATTLHDILKSMIDYQISLISMRTNRVMQFLTVIATIFIPLTFIAGVYGMNFEHMPELSWRYGYYYSLAIMGAVGGGLLIYFLRKRFL
ncbi:MAG: magnesium/cobalt transporter CorA [Pseudomonadota bacterium]